MAIDHFHPLTPRLPLYYGGSTLYTHIHFCCCLLTCSYGFSLEESKERDLGEQAARKALTLNKNNPFATHALGKLCIYFIPCPAIIVSELLLHILPIPSDPISFLMRSSCD